MRKVFLVTTLGFRVHPHRYMAMLAAAAIALNKHTQVYISCPLLAPISFPSTDAQVQSRRASTRQPHSCKESENSRKKIEAVVEERI